MTITIIAMMAHLPHQFDPTHWTDLSSNNITSYARIKTLKESVEFLLITNHLTIIKLNWLTSILGASWAQFKDDIKGASLKKCAQLLTKKMPGIPNVRTTNGGRTRIAKHHVAAMLHPMRMENVTSVHNQNPYLF